MGSTATAADAYNIVISPANTGLLKVKQTEAAAKKVSELLQEDLEKHHVFFNDDGFHNHIVHHLLALYGTSASPSSLHSGYKQNAGYQLPSHPATRHLETWDDARALFGNGDNYAELLRFLQRDITARGWHTVLLDYMLSGSAAADDMLVRTFSGFLHPLIQLMYGIEWDQPAIVAEALAQTAVHKSEGLTTLLLGAEAKSKERGGAMSTIVELYEAVGKHELLNSCVTADMGSKIRDGVLATEERHAAMLAIMSRVKVKPEELEERTAEMFDAAVFVGASAAAHPVKKPKFDFFLIHHINSSPVFVSINQQDWIPHEAKTRLLEWKIRMDLLQYAARACPPLDVARIKAHKPRETSSTDPLTIISRLHKKPGDDGHAVKLGRAAILCERVTKPYQGKGWVQIQGDDLWLQVHRLIIDSVTNSGNTSDWVRTTGLQEAWEDVPDLKAAL